MIHTTTTPDHFTESEVNEALMGFVSRERRQHLVDCHLCQGRLDNFQSTLGVFNQASANWSEAKSNAINRDLMQHRTPFRITQRSAWTSAAALVLVVAATLGLQLHQPFGGRIRSQHQEVITTNDANVRAPGNGDNELAGDNAMLRQIDAAIGSPEPSQQQIYAIETSRGTSDRQSDARQVHN